MKGALQFVALQTSAKKMRACARPTARGEKAYLCVCANAVMRTNCRTRALAHAVPRIMHTQTEAIGGVGYTQSHHVIRDIENA